MWIHEFSQWKKDKHLRAPCGSSQVSSPQYPAPACHLAPRGQCWVPVCRTSKEAPQTAWHGYAQVPNPLTNCGRATRVTRQVGLQRIVEGRCNPAWSLSTSVLKACKISSWKLSMVYLKSLCSRSCQTCHFLDIVVSLAANGSRAAPTTGYSHTNAGRWSVAYLQAQQDAKCAGDTCKVRPQKLYISWFVDRTPMNYIVIIFPINPG